VKLKEELPKKILNSLNTLLEQAQLLEKSILVLGCSTSEILGEKIGSASSSEIAPLVLDPIKQKLEKDNIFLAVQCCEHLNRALIVEEECAREYKLEIVHAIPHLKAGGATAARAMEIFSEPVLVERIQAHAGIDIGDTFIGMHLKPVAVPVRPPSRNLGSAHLTMARTRPRLIGGNRAKY